MDLADLQKEAYDNSDRHGFHIEKDLTLDELAMEYAAYVERFPRDQFPMVIEDYVTALERRIKFLTAALIIPTKLMLIVSELAEAMEEHRAGKPPIYFEDGNPKPEGIGPELADVAIRLGDLAGIIEQTNAGFSLDREVQRKMKFNATRPFKHGGKQI